MIDLSGSPRRPAGIQPLRTQLAVLPLGFVLLLSVVACREQPTIPAAAPAATPSAVEPVPGPAEVSPPKPAAPPPRAGAPAAREVGGVDDQDDLDTPVCLPKSGTGGPWVKAEPVRVVDNTRLGELLTKPEAAGFVRFRIVSAARCAYVVQTGASPPGQVRVLLIETEGADDAFGLLTCQSQSSETLPVGGETRVERQGSLHLHCWHGRCYLRLWTVATAPAALADMQGLLNRIVENLQPADPPDILAAWSDDPSDRLYLVRHLASLSPDPLVPLTPSELQAVNELLGLGPETLMSIVVYHAPGAKRANVVWVVRYPDMKFAEIAYSRYTKHLGQATGRTWESSNLMPPRGRHLLGTWTIEEESLQYRMPAAAERLDRVGGQ